MLPIPWPICMDSLLVGKFDATIPTADCEVLAAAAVADDDGGFDFMDIKLIRSNNSSPMKPCKERSYKITCQMFLFFQFTF